MSSSLTRAAALLAYLLPSVTALPAEALRPRVPWAENGLWNGQWKRDGCNFGPTSRGCWSGDFNVDTDMDLSWPNTGNTYNFEITNTTLAPDGFERPMMVVNGQYPGPAIVANWGDEIEVTVTNHLQVNGSGIHWHGMRQLGTNEMDGVPGVTECPLAPGDTVVYRFQATQYGSSWYHSHYSVQYGEGIVGPMVIHGPATANYDIDLGSLPITDWFHAPMFTVNAASLHANGPPTADNVLVNGSMTSSSGGQYAVTTLTPGKTHLLRLVNTGINNWNHVGLDGHPFTVIAADMIPIEPYEATSIVMAVGQRYDVIINATQPVDNYWLRVGTGGGLCDGPNANAANIRSIFRYAGAAETNPANSTGVTLPTGCGDESNIVPHVKTTVPQSLPAELEVGFTNTAYNSNVVQWLVNGTPMKVNFEYPTLQEVSDGNNTFSNDSHVIDVGQKNQWQYWVIQMDPTEFEPPLPHPIHLHGHDFYVLAQVAGATWNGDISTLTTDNPPRRDTATLPAAGYLVLAFESDNPGAWLMHCHIPFHISAGLGVQFLERESEILGSIGSLRPMQQNCKSWNAFETDDYPQGILYEGDSGL